MFDYLQKFNKLPQVIKDKASSSQVMKTISELEKVYGVDLAIVVMKVMVKDIRLENLPIYFVGQMGLEREKAESLAKDLQERVFKEINLTLQKDIQEEKKEKKIEKVAEKKEESINKEKNEKKKEEVSIEKKKVKELIEEEPEILDVDKIIGIKDNREYSIDLNKEIGKEIKKFEKYKKKIKNNESEKDVTPQIPLIKEKKKEDVEEVMKEIGLLLPSEDLNKRLHTIVNIYLKGIRNKIDTRATLIKDVEQGGLNLTLDQANRILNACDRKKKVEPIETRPNISNTLDKLIEKAEHKGLLTEDYNLKKVIEQKKNKIRLDPNHELETKHKVKGKLLSKGYKVDKNHLLEQYKKEENTDIVEFKAEKNKKTNNFSIVKELKKEEKTNKLDKEKKVNQILNKEKLEDDKKKEIEDVSSTIVQQTIVKPQKSKLRLLDKLLIKKENKKETLISKVDLEPKKISRFEPRVSTKPKIQDIKATPKIMSPTEELRYLSLTDFHRLGKTSQEIIVKIFSKIKLLEEDGFDKMVAGVQAWRESPVNKLYLLIGQEAIKKGISIQDVIEERKSKNQEYLSMEEIEAIIMLNKKLAF